MPLAPLNIRPGINREQTSYTNEGGWWDCDKIRFRDGLPETIGGWAKFTSTPFLGVCRAIHGWSTLDNQRTLAIGTSEKLYVLQGDSLFDITPLRASGSAPNAFQPIIGFNGATTVEVTDVGHGAATGDYVEFSGAVTLGGLITADVLNQEFEILLVLDSDRYYIGVPVLGNASDTGDGGAATVASYQINIGSSTVTQGVGFGAGGYGEDGYGEASATADVTIGLRLWSLDNFGEDLVANVRGGGIYYWDASVGTGTRAVALSSLAGAQSAPTVANQIVVSDRDRHIIAFGCDPEDDPGTQDPMLIRFCDQENAAEWRNLPENTAGAILLSSGSKIIGVEETRQQIMVFTDAGVNVMQFLGPPFTFGAEQVATGIKLGSQNAATAVNDVVYWMGNEEFHYYDGVVRELPCSVKEYVFCDFNFGQSDQVFSGVNTIFGEVWWFYPSAGSTEPDRYVMYSYSEQVWAYGTLSRTAWLDVGIYDKPIAASSDGYLYEHESGLNDGEQNPPAGLAAHIESSQIDLQDGERFQFIRRVIPDLTFRDSKVNVQATLTLKGRNFPGVAYDDADANTVQYTSVCVPPDTGAYTKDLRVRLRCRSVALRLESSGADTSWRLGRPRIEVRPDGRR